MKRTNRSDVIYVVTEAAFQWLGILSYQR